ncbi:hypothetical protein LTR36_000702 [Oleoguttula mirabilis]|uniref:Uncharacterized protein n=1 Tax=Oleoguttula mirabilis TaxID=1507867 RepID=A0AAV9JRX9_9PEZI|nr:hypothetical protein LTR36_000702 [Oleoguttula mirabilis]
MAAKRVGSQCIWPYSGKDWPVVLCDDDTPPSVWVIDDGRLQEYDPHKDYLEGLSHFESNDIEASDDPETRLEKYRRRAFKQDAAEWATPSYWKNVIESRRAGRELEREIAKKGKRKRRHRDGDGDDDVEIIAVRRSTNSSSASSRHKKRSSSGGSQSATSGQLPTPGPTPIKLKVGAHSGLPIRIKESDDEDEDEQETEDDGQFVKKKPAQSDRFTSYDNAKLQRLRQRSSNGGPPGDNVCTIFVGKDETTPFQVPMKAIADCEFLSEQVRFSEQKGSHIDLWTNTSIAAKDFVAIHEYMHIGDFVPRLTRDTPPRIKGLVIQEQRDEVAERCAYIFRTASQLQLASLQSLAVEKLKALYPLSPLRILLVTRIAQNSYPWGCEAEGELFGWLADHIAEYFYALMAEHGAALMGVLRNSDGLGQTVADRVAENPKACSRGLGEE